MVRMARGPAQEEEEEEEEEEGPSTPIIMPTVTLLRKNFYPFQICSPPENLRKDLLNNVIRRVVGLSPLTRGLIILRWTRRRS